MKNETNTLLIPRNAIAPQKSALQTPRSEAAGDAYVRECMDIFEMSQAIQSRAVDSVNAAFSVEVEKALEWASCEDLILLTDAFRHWFEFNGEDRIQGGTLVASILHKCGARPSALVASPTGEATT